MKRLVVAALLLLLAPVAGHLSALTLSAFVAAVLTALALWELRTSGAPASAHAEPWPAAYAAHGRQRTEDVGGASPISSEPLESNPLPARALHGIR